MTRRQGGAAKGIAAEACMQQQQQQRGEGQVERLQENSPTQQAFHMPIPDLPDATTEERVEYLLGALQRLIPNLRRHSTRALQSRVLGEAPVYEPAKQHPHEYLQQLFEWGATDSGVLCNVVVDHREKPGRKSVDLQALHAAGCYPHYWQLPLTAAGVREANQRAAEAAAEQGAAALAQQAIREGLPNRGPSKHLVGSPVAAQLMRRGASSIAAGTDVFDRTNAASLPSAAADLRQVAAAEPGARRGKWSLDVNGWWRYPLSASACSPGGSFCLPGHIYDDLTGRQAQVDKDGLVIHGEAGQSYSLYCKEQPNKRSRRLYGQGLTQWVCDFGAQPGDWIAFKRQDRGREAVVLVRHIAAAEAGAADPADQPAMKRLRSSSSREPEPVPPALPAAAAAREPARDHAAAGLQKGRRGGRRAASAEPAAERRRGRQDQLRQSGSFGNLAHLPQAQQPQKNRLPAELARLLPDGGIKPDLNTTRGRRQAAVDAAAGIRRARVLESGDASPAASGPGAAAREEPAAAEPAQAALQPVAALRSATAVKVAEQQPAAAAAPAPRRTYPRGRHPSSVRAAAAAAAAAAPVAAAPAGPAPQQHGGDAADEAPPPPEQAYWIDREGVFAQVLSRDARKRKEELERAAGGIEITSCHDCQEPCYRLPCKRAGCIKTYCCKCVELYRYLLTFGPGHPNYHLRLEFSRGVCPCCLRVCVRAICRRKRLADLGAPPPQPEFSSSQQVMFAYHLAHKLLPAVEQIMRLHSEEARAVGTDLLQVQEAQIGYLPDGRRAPHSERALCNRCGTCLEALHFHCTQPDCEDDLCPSCAGELRAKQGRSRPQGTVDCRSCGSRMQPLCFLPRDQLQQLLHARQRLDAALGRNVRASSGISSNEQGSAPLGQLRGAILRQLLSPGTGTLAAGGQAEWRRVGDDLLKRLQFMADYGAAHPLALPHSQTADQQRQQRLMASSSPEQQDSPALVAQPQQQWQQQPAVAQAGCRGAVRDPDLSAHIAAATAAPTNGSNGRQASGAPTPAQLQVLQQALQTFLGNPQLLGLFLQQLAQQVSLQQEPLQQVQQLLLQVLSPPNSQQALAQHGVPQQQLRLQQPNHHSQPQRQLHAVQQPGVLRPRPVHAVPGQHLLPPLPHPPPLPQPPPLQPPPWTHPLPPLDLPNGTLNSALQQQQQTMAAAQASLSLEAEAEHAQHAAGRPKRARHDSLRLRESRESADSDWEQASGSGHTQGGEAGAVAARHKAAAPGKKRGRQTAAAESPPVEPLQQNLPSADEVLQRQLWWQLEGLPESDVRLASKRGVQDFIWTPHVREFDPAHPHYNRSVRLFQMLWRRGEPIVVRGLSGQMGWTPEGMARVCKESDKARLKVIECGNFSPDNDWEITGKEFFDRYKACCGDTHDDNGDCLPMLKLKDFPPSSDFNQVLARHHDDFVAMLTSCMPAYCHPTHGPLNMATMLPWYTKLPDLGPKGYIAFGREEEHEGESDSVTKLHEDLSDAVNIMMHAQQRPGVAPSAPRCGLQEPQLPGYGGAGAVWDLVRREDRPRLRQFLEDALAGRIPGCPPFIHKGQPVAADSVHDIIHDQCFMLTERHRQLLRAPPYNVHTWHFEQNEWEAVWIPGGCPHQVRNLRSSIKVALDFVTPEAIGECMVLREEFRQLAIKELEHWEAENPGQKEDDIGSSRHFADKLQVGNMILHGMLSALRLLEAAAAGGDGELPSLPPPLEEPVVEEEEGEEESQQQQQRRKQQAKQKRQQQKGREEESGGHSQPDQGRVQVKTQGGRKRAR